MAAPFSAGALARDSQGGCHPENIARPGALLWVFIWIPDRASLVRDEGETVDAPGHAGEPYERGLPMLDFGVMPDFMNAKRFLELSFA